MLKKTNEMNNINYFLTRAVFKKKPRENELLVAKKRDDTEDVDVVVLR